MNEERFAHEDKDGDELEIFRPDAGEYDVPEGTLVLGVNDEQVFLTPLVIDELKEFLREHGTGFVSKTGLDTRRVAAAEKAAEILRGGGSKDGLDGYAVAALAEFLLDERSL